MGKLRTLSALIPLAVMLMAIYTKERWIHVGVPVSCILVLLFAADKTLKRSHIRIIMASLLLCIAGDWMLAHQKTNPNYFVYGVFLFMIAHMGYLFFCLKNGKLNKFVLLALLVGYGAFFIFCLYPVIDQAILYVAALGYIVFSCLTMAAAIGLKLDWLSKTLFIAGIACFLFSDTLIGFNVFLGKKGIYYLMMPTYYLSHVLVTAALVDKKALLETS